MLLSGKDSFHASGSVNAWFSHSCSPSVKKKAVNVQNAIKALMSCQWTILIRSLFVWIVPDLQELSVPPKTEHALIGWKSSILTMQLRSTSSIKNQLEEVPDEIVCAIKFRIIIIINTLG